MLVDELMCVFLSGCACVTCMCVTSACYGGEVNKGLHLFVNCSVVNNGNAAKSKPLLNKSVISLQPVLVSQVDKYLNLDIWSPKAFGEEFGEFCYNDTSINILSFFTSTSSLRCGPVCQWLM